MKKYYINYITTCIPTGKKYVGSHSTNDLDDGYLGSGGYIKMAISKYGRASFSKNILKYNKTHEECIKWEEIFIKEYDTLYPNGYNKTPTGSGGMKYEYTNNILIESIKRNMKNSQWKKLVYAETGIDPMTYRSVFSKILKGDLQ